MKDVCRFRVSGGLQGLMAATLVLAMWVAGPAAAQSLAEPGAGEASAARGTPVPFECDGTLYLSQAPDRFTPVTLFQVSTADSPFNLVPVGDNSHGVRYNAAGYRIQDNFIYAMETINGDSAVPKNLVRIDATGSVELLGVPTGLPGERHVAGDVTTDGLLYTLGYDTNRLYFIDVEQVALAGGVIMSESLRTPDVAFNPVDGLLYGFSGQNRRLFSIDPQSGQVTFIGPPQAIFAFGALYFSPDGELFGYDNGGQGFFQIDLTDGSGVKLADAPPTTVNDGAICLDEDVNLPDFEVGAAKRVVERSALNPDGSFEVEFAFVIENLDDEPTPNVQLSDDLSETFAGVTSFSIVGAPDLGGLTAPATPYDGSTQINLLAGTDTLQPGQQVTITLRVLLQPGTATGPFLNQARVTAALIPDGAPLGEDLSDDGDDPDPSGDGDPNSDPQACATDPFSPACEDTPTVIEIPSDQPTPVVGIAKQASAPRQVGPSTYDIDFSFVVENLGTIPAPNIQVTDDLSATFPGVDSVEVVGAPSIGGFTAGSPTYDGVSQIALLAGTDTLPVGAVETIAYTVRVDIGDETGPFLNTAIVTSSETPGGEILFEDRSEDGTDPDPSGDDDPNSDPDACEADPFDPDCEDTPTTIDMFPMQIIGIAKEASAPRQVGPSTYDIDFSFVVENFGTIPATNVQVTDDLSATFPGVTSRSRVVAYPRCRRLHSGRSGLRRYDSESLCSPALDTLAVDGVETISYTVRVDVGDQTGPFLNTAIVTVSDTPGGNVLFEDRSEDGTDPDPSGDDDPNSDPDACEADPFDPDCEDTPTTIDMFPMQIIGIAKEASAPRQVGPSTYDIDFSFVVENFGTIPATNVQVTDDLSATFPGVTSDRDRRRSRHR